MVWPHELAVRHSFLEIEIVQVPAFEPEYATSPDLETRTACSGLWDIMWPLNPYLHHDRRN